MEWYYQILILIGIAALLTKTTEKSYRSEVYNSRSEEYLDHIRVEVGNVADKIDKICEKLHIGD